MCELRVGLVAEGPTDAIIIEAALSALLTRPFILTVLQPEETRPAMGTGWGGVLRWCMEFSDRGYQKLEDDPTLPGFDLFIIHIDADVTQASYADVSPEIAAVAAARNWPALPCPVACPPPNVGPIVMRHRVLDWAGIHAFGPNTILCVPSKSIEAWLVAALFPAGDAILRNLECDFRIPRRLGMLPHAQRVRKTIREYLSYKTKVTTNWGTVRIRCTQAEQFSIEIMALPY